MELQDRNRRMTNEKNKYLTIFESIKDPAMLVNTANRVVSVNNAWCEMFESKTSLGADYYSEMPVEKKIPWLQEELPLFVDSKNEEHSFEKELDTQTGRKCFYVKIKKC